MDCKTKLKLRYGATDYVSFEEERNIVEEDAWYGREILQPYIESKVIPSCIEVPVSVLVDDANFPGTMVEMKRDLIFRKDPSRQLWFRR